MSDRFDMWNQVKLRSLVTWRGADGELYRAEVIKFTSPTSYILVRDLTTKRTTEIYIERITSCENKS